METLVANLVGKVERVKLNGRSYIVAPMTLIVPGVLDGSDGPIYYPPDAVRNHAGKWNDIPIVVYHPKVDGQYVSVNSPGGDTAVIGFLKDSTFKGKSGGGVGRLAAKGYFDEESTQLVDKRVYEALLLGKKVELSTGLIPIKLGGAGAHNGVAYNSQMLEHEPDHLAVLPDMLGACAIKHGCGVNVNKASDRVVKKSKVMGGGKDAPASSDKPKKRKRKPKLSVKAVMTTGDAKHVMYVTNGDTDMPKLTDTQRKEHVQYLTANCDCWKSQGDDVVLNKFTDDKLVTLRHQTDKALNAQKVADAAKAGFEHGDKGFVFNESAGKWEPRPDVAKKDTPVPTPTVNSAQSQSNASLPRLTPEEQEDLDFARQEKNKQKSVMVNQLTGHITEPQTKQRLVANLMQKSLTELQDMLLCRPPVPTDNQQGQATVGGFRMRTIETPHYTGAGGGPDHGGQGQQQDDPNDVLPVPVNNWQDIVASGRREAV